MPTRFWRQVNARFLINWTGGPDVRCSDLDAAKLPTGVVQFLDLS